MLPPLAGSILFQASLKCWLLWQLFIFKPSPWGWIFQDLWNKLTFTLWYPSRSSRFGLYRLSVSQYSWLNSKVLVSPSRNSHTHTSVDRALTLKLSWQLNLFSDSSSGGRMAPASCLLLKDNISSWHLPVKVGQGYDSWGVSGAQALFYFFKLLFIHFRPRVACGNLSSLKVKVLVTQLCLTLRPHRL